VKSVNYRGDLFSTVATFFGNALLRLGSSVVLTRLLHPEAYGVVTMIVAAAMIMELLSDLGVTGLVVRHRRGDEASFLNTIWTLRLIRGIVNGGLMFSLAPYISHLYGLPALEGALKLYALMFPLGALESMAYVLAVRHQKVRVSNYIELGCSTLSTIFTIIASVVLEDFRAIVYGMIFNRCLLSLASYRLFDHPRPRFAFETSASRDLFSFSKVILPSSVFTLALTQYDKVIFLRLFDVHLLGLYGIATGIALSIDALTSKVSRSVLYGRCAALYRDDSITYADKYYKGNRRLFFAMLFFPTLLFSGAQLLVDILYDPRYAGAGLILQALAFRGVMFAFLSSAEDMLVAAGRINVVLLVNVFRLAWLVPATLCGAYLFGFNGFLAAIALELVAPVLYVIRVQWSLNLFRSRDWLYKVGVVVILIPIATGGAQALRVFRG
jgi:lipopolysaccharide exporter